jgi:hypothetical protein
MSTWRQNYIPEPAKSQHFVARLLRALARSL